MATKLGEKTREIASTNPWWRDADWDARDHDLKQAAQTGLGYRPVVLANLEEKGLYILRGPRRVGKTVVVKQKIQDLLSEGVPPLAIVRVDVDGWSASDIRTLTQRVALPPLSGGQRRYWFLDEITGVSGEWAQQIKWLRGNDPEFENATVVLTGSSATGLTEAAGILAGRRGFSTNVDRTLLPMGFRTFAGTWHQNLLGLPTLGLDELHEMSSIPAYEEANRWLDLIATSWEVYLAYGGYPIAVSAAKSLKPIPQWFIDSLIDVLFKDAFSKSSIRRAQTTTLVSRLWASMANPVNLTSIARDVGVDHQTVTRHIEYMRDAYLLWECPKLLHPWVPNSRAQEKIYPIDPIIGRLAHLNNSNQPDIDVSILAESQIGTGFRRNHIGRGGIWDTDHSLFYQVTATRKEIDFVSNLFRGAAVEGKYVDSGKWAGEAQTMDAAGYKGIMSTRSIFDVKSNPIWAIPASVLAILTDL
jgi:predicted AAA+ superfamily ATPase